MNQEQKNTIPLLGQPILASAEHRVYVIKSKAQVGVMYRLVCPECGQSVVKKVTKEGRNRWDCPQCKAVLGFVAVNPEEVATAPKPVSEDAPKAASENAQKVTSENAQKVTTENAPKAAGHNETPRPQEEKPQASQPQNPEPEIPEELGHTRRIGKVTQQEMGELVWGSFFSRKHFALRPGVFFIGRKDSGMPSDIQLNDKYVSRRSAALEVIPNDNGVLFKLIVKHAVNPVYVNGSVLSENSSIYLNYGDELQFGKTKITFKKQGK